MNKWIEIAKGSNLHHVVEIKAERCQLFKHNDTFYKIIGARNHQDNHKRKSHFEIELTPVI